MRLTSATLTFLVLPLVLTVGILGAVGLQVVEQQTEQRMREDIELIARAIEGPVSRALNRGEEGAVQDVLDATLSFGRVYGAHVLDRDGEAIASAGAGVDALPPNEIDRIGDAEAREGLYTFSAGEPLFAYFVPLPDNSGRFNALLQVSRHAGDFQRYLDRLNRIGMVSLIALVLALAAITLLGHRHAIGRPLANLTATMTRIAAGEPDQRAAAAGPLELRRLTLTFNSMMDRLQQSAAEIIRRQERETSLERRLEHSRRLAAVGELASGVAHELGTPLSVIDGRAQRLLRRTRGTATANDLAAVRDEVRRIGRIVRQLQDFARQNPLHRSPVDVRELIEALLNRMQPEMQQAGVQPEVADIDCGPTLDVDADRLQQALGNLLQNAAQAADAAHPRVRIGCYQSVESTVFTVEDNGGGIDPAIRARLFEPFFTTKAVGEGMGLGLSVVHREAEDHGGWVEVGRAALGGARFELHLPNAEANPEDSDER